MAARGARLTAAADFLSLTGSPIVASGSEDFTLCGWLRIRAALAAEDFVTNWCMLYAGSGGNRGWYMCQVAGDDPRAAAHPYQMEGHAKGNVPITVGAANANLAEIDEDWFYAFVYDRTGNLGAGKVTFYYGKDASGTLTAITTVDESAFDDATSLQIGRMGAETGAPCNGDVTNVKAWKRVFSGAELLAEMESENPVISTGLYAHWKLATGTDLTDYSGNGHTLTSNGTPGNGVMDPVDLQGGGGGGGGGSFKLIENRTQNLGNGFRAVTAAQLQGALVT